MSICGEPSTFADEKMKSEEFFQYKNGKDS